MPDSAGTLPAATSIASGSQPQVAPRARLILGALGIGIAILATHGIALPGAFVWDDQLMIADNTMLRSFAGLTQFWFSTEQADYWPVAYTSHWIEFQIWGDWAPGYRLTNLALHIANCILLWRLLLSLQVPGAWVVATLFAVHPVTIEATAWILQRKTLLSTLGAWLCAWCWLRGETSDNEGWQWGALLALLLGLLSKSAVVTWPVVILGYEVWRAGKLTADAISRTTPLFLLSLILGLVGTWFQLHNAIGDDNVRDDDLLSRAALAGRAVWFYLQQAVWPREQLFVYPRWTLGVQGIADFVPLAALAAIFAALFLLRRKFGSGYLTAAGYYVVCLFPALGFVNIYFMRYSLVADHWQYLALPAVPAVVVSIVLAICPQRAWRWTMPLAALAIGLLGFLSIEHAKLFAHENNIPLWEETLARNPQCWLAKVNLGALSAHRRDFVAAQRYYTEALRDEPDYPQALRGLELATKLAPTQTDPVKKMAARVSKRPEDAELHFQFAELLFEHEHPNEAIEQLRECLRQDNEHWKAATRLAWELATHWDDKQYDPAAAYRFAQQACHQPGGATAAALDALAAAEAGRGEFDSAVSTARRALGIARSRASTRLVNEIDARLTLYQAGKPYRQSRPSEK